MTLTWDAVAGAGAYNIYRDVEPYFLPDAAYATTPDLSWTDPDGGGDPLVNYTYMIRAANPCGESSMLYRVGEFEFELTPGG